MIYRIFLCSIFGLFYSINIIYAQSTDRVIVLDDLEDDRFNMISAPYDIEFNLPQFDIVFDIPAHVTFKLPVTIADNVALDINRKTYYSFDSNYLNNAKTRMICFYDSFRDEEPSLVLEIEPLGKEKLLEYDEQIAPIKTKLGKSVTQIIDTSFYQYSFLKGGYCFNFILNVGLLSKSNLLLKYKSIIQSIAPKNLYQERVKYENRVKYGYYKLNKKTSLPPNEKYKFDYYKGKTTREDKAVNPFAETEINIPSGTEYMIKANLVEEVGEDSLFVFVDINDFIRESQCIEHYFLKDFNLSIYSQSGINDLRTNIEQKVGNSPYFKFEASTIGQDSILIYYYGSREVVTLDISIPTIDHNSVLNILVYNYSEKTKDDVLKILSTFRYKGNPLPQNLGELIILENEPKIDYVTIDLPSFRKDYENVNSFTLNLVNVGLSMPLIGKLDEYELINSQETINIPSDGIITLNKPQGQQGLSILRKSNSSFVYIQEIGERSDVDEYLQDWVKLWNSYGSFDGLEAGYVIFNNRRWNIVYYKTEQTYSATATTYINGCSVSLYINGVTSKEKLFEELAYIKTFKFVDSSN